jgi:hypothetical protein
MPHLENWAILKRLSPYEAPELSRSVLVGTVTGHPRLPDGEVIETSPIVAIQETIVLTVSGSEYTLGEADPFYEAVFPNARERLFGSV